MSKHTNTSNVKTSDCNNPSTLQILVVIICTTCFKLKSFVVFSRSVYVGWYDSHNKQLLFTLSKPVGWVS